MANHPAWQRILHRVRAREDALPLAGPTGPEVMSQLHRDLRNLQGQCGECGADLPTSFATVIGKLGGRYKLCGDCFAAYDKKESA